MVRFPLFATITVCFFTALTNFATAVPVTSGLVIQLDAAAANVTQEATTGTNGQPRVSSWNDIAALGGANNATQSTDTSRPEYYPSVAVLNNQPALRFAGGPDDFVTNGAYEFLNIAGAGANFTTAATMFIVAVPETTATDNMYTLYDTGNADTWWNFQGTSGYSGTFRTPRFDGTIPAGGAVLSGQHIFEINSAASYTYYEDGTPKGSSSDGAFTGGTTHRIGNSVTNPFNIKAFEGYVAEVLVYNRLLTTAERNEVGVYLENKYALITAYVPEPTSGAAALIGALGLLLLRQRNRD